MEFFGIYIGFIWKLKSFQLSLAPLIPSHLGFINWFRKQEKFIWYENWPFIREIWGIWVDECIKGTTIFYCERPDLSDFSPTSNLLKLYFPHKLSSFQFNWVLVNILHIFCDPFDDDYVYVRLSITENNTFSDSDESFELRWMLLMVLRLNR